MPYELDTITQQVVIDLMSYMALHGAIVVHMPEILAQ